MGGVSRRVVLTYALFWLTVVGSKFPSALAAKVYVGRSREGAGVGGSAV